MTPTSSVAPGRVLAWAAMSSIGWVAAFAMAFFIVAAAGTFGILNGDPFGLRLDLALVLILHGALAMSAVRLAAWLALGAWPLTRARHAAVPALGVGLAVLVELALHEWAEARHGYYDAQLIGWTALLSIALVATATATFGVAIAPRGAAVAPVGALLLAGAGVMLIVVSNLRGLGDGIGPAGWPLAMLVGLSAAYVLAAAALAARRLRPADDPRGPEYS